MSEAIATTGNVEAKPISWEAVKALAMVVGVREAARRMELSEEQVKKRCTREGWLSDPRARQAVTNAVALRSGISAPVPMSPKSPAALIAQELAELNAKSRLSLARGMSKASTTIENMDGQEIVADAGNVKAIVQATAQVHAWADQPATSRVRLEVLLSKPEPTTIDVESQVVDSQWDDAGVSPE